MTEILALHRRTMDTAAAIVHRIEPEQLGLPTPCAGWDLGRLLAHMIGQNHGFASAARGEPFSAAVWDDRAVFGPPGPVFAESAAATVAAFATDGAAEREWHLLVGANGSMPVPGSKAMGFHFIDYVVHGWDVAVSIGLPPESLFDDEILDAVLPLAEEVPLDGPTRSGPYAPFGPAVPLAQDRGKLDRLLAVLGRDPQWRPGPA
jgi:uncharacterized protein (TIGR03086 family)